LRSLPRAGQNEVLGATWDEIDLGSQVWTIPAARMKAGGEHRVPLSEAAARLLEDMARIRVSEFVFPSLDKRSRGPLSNMALAMVLRRMGEGNSTVHGFRSAFRDWCGEETSFPREICEAALAHALRTRRKRLTGAAMLWSEGAPSWKRGRLIASIVPQLWRCGALEVRR
jgi:integrase